MPDEPNEVESLKHENAELRERLAKAQSETALYRKAAYEMLDKLMPSPTDEEIAEQLSAPRGRSVWEILEECDRMPQG